MLHYSQLVLEVIDVNVHLGLKLFPAKEPPVHFILNPAYKFACKCCVDGFYQQYLLYPEKSRLGMYNPICRVPPEVEVSRQVERGIVGFVLNPINHGYNLKEISPLIHVLEKYDLPLFVYTGKGNGNPSHLREYLSRVPLIILIHSGYPDYVNEAEKLLKEEKVLFETSLVPHEISLRFRGRRIFGSCYPFHQVDFEKRISSLMLDERERKGYAEALIKHNT